MSNINPSKTQAPQDPALPDDLPALRNLLQEMEVQLKAQDGDLAAFDAALKEARLTAHERATRILEAQVEIRILEGARDAANARLDTARAEVLTLTRLLAQSEPRAGSDLGLDTFARTLDRQAQQLEAQTREMAELTRLLASSEEQTRRLQKARSRMVAWLPEMMDALLPPADANGSDTADTRPEGTPPRGRFLTEAKYAECARLLTASGAFDPEHYLKTNPDVAANGTDPALHFVKYGLTEGRAPRDLTQPRNPVAAPLDAAPAQDDPAPEPEATTETGAETEIETVVETEAGTAPSPEATDTAPPAPDLADRAAIPEDVSPVADAAAQAPAAEAEPLAPTADTPEAPADPAPATTETSGDTDTPRPEPSKDPEPGADPVADPSLAPETTDLLADTQDRKAAPPPTESQTESQTGPVTETLADPASETRGTPLDEDERADRTQLRAAAGPETPGAS